MVRHQSWWFILLQLPCPLYHIFVIWFLLLKCSQSRKALHFSIWLGRRASELWWFAYLFCDRWCLEIGLIDCQQKPILSDKLWGSLHLSQNWCDAFYIYETSSVRVVASIDCLWKCLWLRRGGGRMLIFKSDSLSRIWMYNILRLVYLEKSFFCFIC